MRAFWAAGFVSAWIAAAAGPAPPLGLDRYLPAPRSNPLTPEKAALGQALFESSVLSRDRSIACSSCHDSKRAFTDAHPVAQGIGGRHGDRRTPTLVNRAFGKAFFWDGRVRTLEDQVLLPITNPREMDLTVAEALARLRSEPVWEGRFQSVFGRSADEAALADALATYVRTILSGDSPYDRFMAGDTRALGPDAQMGLRLFRGKAGCLACHVGVNFTDERLHNTGLGRFKTPTLRQVADRPPYLHDGSLATLEEVIEFYDGGGKPHPDLDPEIQPLSLTKEEKRALLAFLRSLSGRVEHGPWR